MDNNSFRRSFLPTNSWRAFKQRFLRILEPIPGLLGWELVEHANKILVEWLSKHSTLSSKILQLKRCTRSLSIYPLKLFPQFPSIEFIWSTFTSMITSLEWGASSLFNGHFYKDYLGLLGQLSLIEPPALIPLSWGIIGFHLQQLEVVWGCCHMSVCSPPSLFHQFDR